MPVRIRSPLQIHHIIMRQDIYEYLHELGWSFSHETEDGKRLWARAFYDPYTKNMTCLFDDEEHLIEMAMEAMGA